MASYSKCFSCFVKIRTLVWIIAIFNMGFFPLCFSLFVFLQIFKENGNGSFAKYLHNVGFVLFTSLFLVYFNNNLKKATIEHRIQYVKEWILFHSLYYIIGVTFCLCFALINYSNRNDLFVVAVGFVILGLYEMYVVKQFYNDEIRHLVASCCNLDV